MKILGNIHNKIRVHNAKKFVQIDKNLSEIEKKILKSSILPLAKFARGENMKLVFSKGEDLFQNQTVMKVRKQESLLTKTEDNEYFIHWIWRNIGETFIDLTNTQNKTSIVDELINTVKLIKSNFYKKI